MKELATWALLATLGAVVLMSAHAPGGDPAVRAELGLRAALAATRGPGHVQTAPTTHESAPVVATVLNTPYLDAKPVLEALRQDLLPEELRSKPHTEIEAAWPGWLSRRDRAIRARLEDGDKDSIVNFLVFGTTFTHLPRATGPDLAALAGRPSGVPTLFTGRIEDLIAGIASPGENERLQFARHVVERSGIDPEAAGGKDQMRRYLTESLRQVLPAEHARDSARREANLRHDPIAQLLERTTFHDRGLSSDTSLLIDFGLERTLDAIKAKGLLAADSVGRVGIVGAGLDFTDKHDGHDFYPQQTIQPFAIIDSLTRLGLAKSNGLHLTTFDLSPRINQHLEAARQRARAGTVYPLALPRNMDLPWNPSLVAYWERFGATIGEVAQDVAVPPNAGTVQVRAVRVRPAVVMSIVPQDVNIVLQRLEPLSVHERFDLIIATDVLIYYDVFEQSLALANVAKMLRPGGLFLSNNAVFELQAIPIGLVGYTDVIYMTLPGVGEIRDRLVWYQRQ